MACPGGCIGGGGQPRSTDKGILAQRQAAMYNLDERSTIRRSHENPMIARLYEQWLSKVGRGGQGGQGQGQGQGGQGCASAALQMLHVARGCAALPALCKASGHMMTLSDHAAVPIESQLLV